MSSESTAQKGRPAPRCESTAGPYAQRRKRVPYLEFGPCPSGFTLPFGNASQATTACEIEQTLPQ